MNDWQQFQRAAETAARETRPPIDVRQGVLGQIAAARPSPAVRKRPTTAAREIVPWACMSTASAAAAAAVVAVAYPLWTGLTDPMAGFVDVLTMVMQ